MNSSRFIRVGMCFAPLMLLVVGAVAHADEADGGLPRAGYFGAAVTPVPDDVRAAQKLGEGAGVLVRAVIPGSAASEAGLEPGDVITAVDGAKIPDTAAYVGKLGHRKAGEKVAVVLMRDAKEEQKAVELKPREREKGTEEYDVLYDAVESRGNRLRTVVTRPKGEGKHPALFLIQGLGGFSIENVPGSPGFYKPIIDDFARRGYVTLRVDKPGQGDSQGGPTQDVDFETELDGYRQALKALVAYDFVDKDHVVIFGHSMGGVIGPLIALDTPVKGIGAYGTVAKTWQEYLLENTRRQMALAGADSPAIDEALRADSVINHEIFTEGKSTEAVIQAHPELRDRVGEVIHGGRYYSGRDVAFFRQLATKNLPAAWEKFGGSALAVWGTADFVSSRDDHALIADTVNAARPGQGTFLAIEGADHGFNRADSIPDAFENFGRPGDFHPEVLRVLRDWSLKLEGKPAEAK